jgi:hypothetical protein
LSGVSGRGPRDQGWLVALLPAFPLALLVLRLWYASRQDTQTLLLLVQHVSPLGLLSSIVPATLWVLPAVILGGRALGVLYRISTGRSSLLVRAADRVPDWVVVLAVVLAFFLWQLRFLPVLGMVALSVAGLTTWDRHRGPDGAGVRRAVCYVTPLVAAVLLYALLAPAIAQAAERRDAVTFALLAVPPGLAVLLTGPVPRASARLLTHGAALTIIVLVPVLVGGAVLRAPILPLTAVEVAAAPDDETPAEVVVGQVITGDDRMVTMLDRTGRVRFIRNEQVLSRTLCPDPGEAPRSHVHLHGWYVERNMISWLAPDPLPPSDDPRCEGRVTPAE